MSNINFDGIDDVIDGFGRANTAGLRGVKQAVDDAAGNLLSESVKEVPHEYGTLQGTGNVSAAVIGDEEIIAEVGYNTPYAAKLHEHPEYRFKKGRKGKFLEDPLKRMGPTYQKDIGASLNKALGG
jgi:hypothetical protein